MLRLARPLLTILTASFALSAGAQIFAERPVSTPVYTPVTSIRSAAIASDGDQFFAAWTDANGAHGSRIDRDGTLLDPAGIFLGPAYGSYLVGVAWDEEAYVVVWSGLGGIQAARIGSDGKIITPAHLIFQNSNERNRQNPIAANSNVTVIATALGYFVLDHDLRLLITGSLDRASVFRTGADEFTLLSDSRAQRLDASGRSLSIAVLNGFVDDSISCHGIDCIRVSSSTTTKQLTVAPYDPTKLTIGAPIDLAMTQRPFALVATTTGYILATSDGSIQRLDLAGHPIGSPTTPCCVPSGAIAAASNGREVIVLRQSYFALTFGLITSSSESTPRHLAISANAQRTPAIAKSATNYLVAWTENDGVYAGRLSWDGSILDGRGRRLVDVVPSVFSPRPPLTTSVTFDGASYLVAISASFDPAYGPQRNGSITTVRIDPATGATLAMNNAMCGTDMRIASNGSATVAAWVDCAGGVDVAFLDVNGALASIPVTLAIPLGAWQPVAHPSLAWNGNEWLITWEDQFEWTVNDPFFYPDHVTSIAVRGARLSSALTPIDTKPITITNRDDFIDSSRVASDGHDFLAVWSGNNTIHARSITASGIPGDDQRVPAGQLQDLAWDGTAYGVAFTSVRNPYDAPANLGLIRLRPNGQPIESQSISNTPDDERSAALVALGGGQVLAAYTRVDNGVERVFIATPHASRVRSSRTETP
ncbi:MAG: hypothetical protein QOK37_1824 [Thermoanaerobaculia bacterium]|jgi:hypothetical protein|nr:hypothetical protein [Thermoanaerobaculia bacterium]